MGSSQTATISEAEEGSGEPEVESKLRVVVDDATAADEDVGSKVTVEAAPAPDEVVEAVTAAVDEVEGKVKAVEALTTAPDDGLGIDLGALTIQVNDEPPPVEEEEAEYVAVTTDETIYSSATTFEELNLTKELLDGLYGKMDFKKPSRIQAASLPMILTPPHKHLVAQAHNGSGKTTCFILGMLSRVDPKMKMPQALCICPTREIADQNQKVLTKMGEYTGITSRLATPGRVPTNQLPLITEQVIIGTPGTIKSWVSNKKLSVRELKVLVFDEADHMLGEDGFRVDSEKIMIYIQKSQGSRTACQVLLFSATFDKHVKAFVDKEILDANQLYVNNDQLALESVKQYKVTCPDELSKRDVIRNRIMEFDQSMGQTIIFVKTRNSAAQLHASLREEGYECTTIHGALGDEDRRRIIQEFKDGYTNVLITTDLLARGFDQAKVSLVVNYDLPVPVRRGFAMEPNYEVYLHRIGRAGRFGRKGAAFTLLCTDAEINMMKLIESHFSHPITEVPNWDSEDDFKAALQDAGLYESRVKQPEPAAS